MDIKATLQKLLISLVLSPIVFYVFYGLANLMGASYKLSHGESFIIWVLMAILINLSMTKKN